MGSSPWNPVEGTVGDLPGTVLESAAVPQWSQWFKTILFYIPDLGVKFVWFLTSYSRILDFVLCSEDPEVFFLFVEAVGHVDQYLAGSLKSSATEHRKISFKNQTRVSPDPHEGYHSNFGSGGSCHRIKPEVSMSLNSMPPECCHGDHAQPISDIYNMYGHCSFHAHQLSGNWPPGRDCKHSFRAGCGIDHRPTPTISSKSGKNLLLPLSSLNILHEEVLELWIPNQLSYGFVAQSTSPHGWTLWICGPAHQTIGMKEQDRRAGNKTDQSQMQDGEAPCTCEDNFSPA